MIFIPGNTPSSKNSKQWTGKYLVSSKLTQKYHKNTAHYWIDQKELFLKMLEGKEKPYNISFYFVRDSLRRFDYINVVQYPLDLMQEYGWLEDDSAYYVRPLFEGFEVNKTNPGVYIDVK